MNYDPLFETALPLIGLLVVLIWMVGKAILWDVPRWFAEQRSLRRANNQWPYKAR